MTRKLKIFAFISLLALTSNLVCSILVSLSDTRNELSLTLTEEENEGEGETDNNTPTKNGFNLLEEELHFADANFYLGLNECSFSVSINNNYDYIDLTSKSYQSIIDNPPENC